jgi:hypothetical protein
MSGVTIAERAEHHLEYEHRQRRRAQRGDDRHLVEHRQSDLEGMEARRRGDVEIGIGVMDLVQPPQQGYAMRRPVLKEQRQIEQRQHQQQFEPDRQGELVEQPPPPDLGKLRGSDHQQRHREADQRRIEREQAQIGGPAPAAAMPQSAARGRQLDCGERHENQRRRREGDQRE